MRRRIYNHPLKIFDYKMSGSSYFSSISPDLLAIIFSSLSLDQIFDICQTHALRVCESQNFWNSLYFQTFGKPLSSGRAKDWYKLAYLLFSKYKNGNLTVGANQMAKRGLLHEVEYFISKGAKIIPVLLIAILSCQTKVVRFLVGKLSHEDRQKINPTISYAKCDDIIEILLPLISDKDRVLKEAARNGNPKMFFLMVKEKANIFDPVVMQFAAIGGSPDIIKYLFSQGILPSALDLRVAAGLGHLDAVKLIIEYGVITFDDAFEYAALKGKILVVEHLAQYLTGVNKVLRKGIQLNNINLIKYAIENGAIITQEILKLAIDGNNLEILKLIIKSNPSLDLAEAYMYAFDQGQTKFTRYIGSLI